MADEALEGTSSSPRSWLLLLSQIAKKWAASLDQPRAQALRNLGRNFYKLVQASFQNIFTVNSYLEVGTDLEEKIHFRREIAIILVISYKSHPSSSSSISTLYFAIHSQILVPQHGLGVLFIDLDLLIVRK